MGKEDIIGKKYGRWEVIDIAPPGKRGKAKLKCKCSCDKQTIRDVDLSSLKAGRSGSCGCLTSESTIKRLTKHNLRQHPLYSIWSDIKKRCSNINNNNYKNYGGRGIIVCAEWIDNPKQFIDWCLENGWKDGLQIDRKNNNGNYEPNNCRFVTPQVNNENRRLIQSRNTSGYRGVYFHKSAKSYCAKIIQKYQEVYMEYGFPTAKQAAIARDIYCIEHNVPLPLNFPELREKQYPTST